MINCEALRKKIIDLAISGKLVPQDPNDEPASALLERIEKERQQKGLKLKKSAVSTGDNPYYGKLRDECRYVFPATWVSENLDGVAEILTGTSYQPKNINQVGKGIRILRGGNIINSSLSFLPDDVYVDSSLRDTEKQIAIGDILYVASTGSLESIGKNALVEENVDGCQIGAFLRIVRPNRGIVDPFYLWLIFQSTAFRKTVLASCGGTNINNVSGKKLGKMVVPIPPKREQQRIVSKTKQLLEWVDEISGRQERYHELEALLRSKVLDLAIRGKLVPQDPDDEPASVLLERIKAERDRLAKEGKIKLPKTVSEEISEADKNYYGKLPDHWAVERLGVIGAVQRGNGLSRSQLTSSGLPCVRYGELYTTYKYHFHEAVSHTSKDTYDNAVKVYPGDVLVALTGENPIDIAKGLVYLGNVPLAMGGDMAVIKNLGVDGEYLSYLLNSSSYIAYKKQLATGHIIVHLGVDRLASIPISLPPKQEQKRIVYKIKSVFEAIDRTFS